MIVVADTGPIHYLFLIGHIDILPALFGQVLVPTSVINIELRDQSTPEDLRKFLANTPSWLVVPKAPTTIPSSLNKLGLGEREAIALALELHANLMLSDDAAARRKAAQLGVISTGTLGLIDEAAVRGLLEFDNALDRLANQTNFHCSPELIKRVRLEHQRRLRKRDTST
jgi:predicted nucleic acid-binding protein